MKLADFKKDDGWEGPDECWYDDIECLLHSGFMSFCCCGNPTDSLLYVLQGLELIGERSEGVPWDEWYAGHRERCKEHFKTEGAEYFFYYWTDKEKLTEHGGSVPGWLQAKGEDLLTLLREWRDSLPEDERTNS